MLMLIYDIDAEAAFDLLRWLSQASNVKVRSLCERLCIDLRGVTASGTVDKTAFDRALFATPSTFSIARIDRSCAVTPPAAAVLTARG